MIDVNDRRILELEDTIKIKERNLEYFNEKNQFYSGYVQMIFELKKTYKELTGISYEERMRDKEREERYNKGNFIQRLFRF